MAQLPVMASSFAAALSTGPVVLSRVILSESDDSAASEMIGRVVEATKRLEGFPDWSNRYLDLNDRITDPMNRRLRLAPSLETIPPRAWPIFMDLLKRQSSGVAPFPPPRIQVIGGSNRDEQFLRDAIEALWPNLPQASLFEPQRTSSFRNLSVTELIHAKKILFSLSPPPQEKGIVSLRYEKDRSNEDTLSFCIGWNDDFLSREDRHSILFYCLQKSMGPSCRCTFRKNENPDTTAKYPNVPLPKKAEDLSLVQQVLLEGRGPIHLTQALLRFDPPKRLKDDALARLSKTKFALQLNPRRDSKVRIDYELWNRNVGDIFFVKILWPETHWEDVQAFDLWAGLARGLLLFVDHEASRRLFLFSEYPPFEVDLDEKLTGRTLDSGKVKELHDLQKWFASFVLPPQSLAPGAVREMKEAGVLPSLWPFESVIERFVIKDLPEGQEPHFTFKQVPKGLDVSQAALHIETHDDFLKRPFIEWIEMAWRFGYGQRSNVRHPLDKFPAFTEAFADTWTWIRLLWAYQSQFSSPTSADNLSFLNVPEGQRDSLSRGLVSSRRFDGEWHSQPTANDRPKRLFLEWSRRFRDPKASLIQILITPGARLVHLNGEPDLSHQEWRALMGCVLQAPPGMSQLPVQKLLQRFQEMKSGFDEARLALNTVYASASPQEKLSYKKALTIFIKLTGQDVRDLPRPDSIMSAETLKKLYTALVHKYHPDHRNTDGKDEGGDFQSLKEAYEILKRFHP